MSANLTLEDLKYLERESLAIELDSEKDEEADLSYFELLADAGEYPLGY